MRSRSQMAYILLLDLAAAAALLLVPMAALWDRWPITLLLASMGVLAGASRVRIPGLKTHMAAVDPLVFSALAIVGPAAACLVGIGAVIGTLLRPQAKPRAKHVAFNLANVVLSIAAAGWAFTLLGGRPDRAVGLLLLPLAASVAAYFLTNSSLLSVILTLDAPGERLLAVWRRCFPWTLPAYVGGLVLAIGLYAVLRTHVAGGLILGAAACWLLVHFFRAHARAHPAA